MLQDERRYHKCEVWTLTDISTTGAADGVKCLGTSVATRL